MDHPYSRAPKQTRSRQSFDRMLDTAIEIINEGGLTALTLAEVSRRSRVSIGSIPRLAKRRETLSAIRGTLPPPNALPAGCRFAPRCPFATAQCIAEPPPRRDVGWVHVTRFLRTPLAA